MRSDARLHWRTSLPQASSGEYKHKFPPCPTWGIFLRTPGGLSHRSAWCLPGRASRARRPGSRRKRLYRGNDRL